MEFSFFSLIIIHNIALKADANSLILLHEPLKMVLQDRNMKEEFTDLTF
jgi:hypothetical protein